MNSQAALVFVVLAGLCSCAQIQAGSFFGSSEANPVKDCRNILLKDLKKFEIPAEFKKVIANVRMVMPELKKVRLSTLVSEHLDVSKYMAEQMEESNGRLVAAAAEFKNRAQELSSRANCAQADYEKLTDIEGADYQKLISKKTILDDFGAFAYLAKKIDASSVKA